MVEAAGTLYCKPCSSRCKTCVNDFDQCASCNDPAVLDTNTAKCICPDGMYLAANGQCVSCISNCNLCTDGLACDVCAPLYVRNNEGQCILTCPRGTYKDGGSCT